ncbi:MAG: antibiotic biosynthesis monooxygenase [Demequinaceae bacterium]|nr:antibiotic biosynthesis monooxygenase [Demequinaceae bacterium]
MRRVLYARFTALPHHCDAVGEMLSLLAASVRSEPGNVRFDAWLEEGGRTYFVYEEYADADAFTAHITADYVADFNTRLGPLIEEPHSMLTWLTPIVVSAA